MIVWAWSAITFVKRLSPATKGILAGAVLLAAAGAYHWLAVKQADREGYRRAQLECAAEKEASKRDAEKFDGERQARQLADMARQVQEANRRAQEARDEADASDRTFAEEDRELGRTADGCALGPRSRGGLQPKSLPYPSPNPPRN